jgi:putative addiction module antidote
MQIKLRKIGNGLGVLLPAQAVRRLNLAEGDHLTLVETNDGFHLSPFEADFNEQVEAFRRTESRHRNSYRTLAK